MSAKKVKRTFWKFERLFKGNSHRTSYIPSGKFLIVDQGKCAQEQGFATFYAKDPKYDDPLNAGTD